MGKMCSYSLLPARRRADSCPHQVRQYNIGKDTAKLYVRPTQLRWKELFTSKVDTETRWNRWDAMALVIAVITVILVFALKLKTFYDLGYSWDLFTSVQAARSWLEGKGLLQDNCFGNLLAIHTYFLLPPLGLLAKPFGAPSLLFVLAVSVGAAYFWAARLLRLFVVAGPVAVDRGRATSCLTVLRCVLSRAILWISCRDSHPGIMFDFTLLPPSAAGDPVNPDRDRLSSA